MATLVETRDLKLIIDPAAAVAPRRYGLPPHPKELSLLEEYWRKIASAAEECEIVVVTHYHYDHHSFSRFLEEIYKGRIVIVKDPENMINFNQRRRAHLFLERIRPLAAEILIADGKNYMFGGTSLEFSKPVPHGSTDNLGYVVELNVREQSESFLFTSDVQGFPLDSQVRFVLEKKPGIILADGPPTYILGSSYTQEEFEASIRNIRKIMGGISLSVFMLDHHFLRDIDWRKHFERIFGNSSVTVKTTAEYVGREIMLLEALRLELYGRPCTSCLDRQN